MYIVNLLETLKKTSQLQQDYTCMMIRFG